MTENLPLRASFHSWDSMEADWGYAGVMLEREGGVDRGICIGVTLVLVGLDIDNGFGRGAEAEGCIR